MENIFFKKKSILKEKHLINEMNQKLYFLNFGV